MAPTTERQLVAQIRRALLDEFPTAWIVKTIGGPFGDFGLPDLLCCVHGRFVGIEVKNVRPGESRAHALARVTPIQHRQLAAVRMAGGIAGVALSVDEALVIARTASPPERREG